MHISNYIFEKELYAGNRICNIAKKKMMKFGKIFA